jgi:hypothetical protein
LEIYIPRVEHQDAYGKKPGRTIPDDRESTNDRGKRRNAIPYEDAENMKRRLSHLSAEFSASCPYATARPRDEASAFGMAKKETHYTVM